MPSAVLRMTTVPVTSVYGWRVLRKTKQRNHHDGVDTANGSKYPHSAFGDGVVVESPQLFKHWKYGWYIRIKHADGIETSHHSLDKPALFKVGQRVRMGDIIGYAGASALAASGAHVHNALWLDGQHVDPLAYLTPGVPVTVTVREPVPVAIPDAPASIPHTSIVPTGDTVFIAVRNGSFYLAVPRAGQITLVPLGREDVTEDVPVVRFNTAKAWDTFLVCVSNPGVL